MKSPDMDMATYKSILAVTREATLKMMMGSQKMNRTVSRDRDRNRGEMEEQLRNRD